MKDLQLIAATMLLVGANAMAAQSHYVATLAEPIAAKRDFIVNGNIWRCEASTCTLISAPLDAGSNYNCHQLQRQVGQLTAYGIEGKQFDADKLSACNAHG